MPDTECNTVGCLNTAPEYAAAIHRPDRDEPDRLCDDCFRNSTFRCAECGDRWYRRDSYEYRDDLYCEGCYTDVSDNDDDSDGEPIYYHSYKPFWVMQLAPHEHQAVNKRHRYIKPLMLGFELETEMRTRGSEMERLKAAADLLQQTGTLMFCKNDGSLNHGFEIVTHPMSREYIREVLPEKLTHIDNLRTTCRSYNSTCGFHIHIGRNALSKLTLYKMTQFIYSNRAFIEMIGQRSLNNSYCGYPDSANRNEFHKAIAKGSRGNGRYYAVNVSNSDTIELRFMKGNLIKGRIQKNLEFAMACVDFARETSLKDLHSADFLAYLKLNRHHYPNLWQFVNGRKYRAEAYPIERHQPKAPTIRQPRARRVSYGHASGITPACLRISYRTRPVSYPRLLLTRYPAMSSGSRAMLCASTYTVGNYFVEGQGTHYVVLPEATEVPRLRLTDRTRIAYANTWADTVARMYVFGNSTMRHNAAAAYNSTQLVSPMAQRIGIRGIIECLVSAYRMVRDQQQYCIINPEHAPIDVSYIFDGQAVGNHVAPVPDLPGDRPVGSVTGRFRSTIDLDTHF